MFGVRLLLQNNERVTQRNLELYNKCATLASSYRLLELSMCLYNLSNVYSLIVLDDDIRRNDLSSGRFRSYIMYKVYTQFTTAFNDPGLIFFHLLPLIS